MEKKLILTMGLPRSGKSTWVAEFISQTPGVCVVNPDSIRLALYGERFRKEGEAMVWTIANYMVKSLFLSGNNAIILDATNVERARRAAWVSEEWVTYAKVFITEPEICKERAILTNQPDLIEIIDYMMDKWEPIHEDEGIITMEPVLTY